MGVVPAHLVSHLHKHSVMSITDHVRELHALPGVRARSQSWCWRFADRYTDHQSWTHDPCAWRRASTFLQVEAIANTILQWNRLRVVK